MTIVLFKYLPTYFTYTYWFSIFRTNQHKYVEKVDNLIISKIDKNDYFIKTINTCLKESPELHNKYYVLLKDNDSRRKIFIRNLLQNMAHLSNEDLKLVSIDELISTLNKNCI